MVLLVKLNRLIRAARWRQAYEIADALDQELRESQK